jgi:hypothetical protein
MHLACPEILSILRSGATVVTPSRLLARVVSHNVAEEWLKSGVDSWRRPAVYTARTWLKACWERVRYSATDVPALLSSAQEHALWERVIKGQTPALFDIESTASLASRASALVAEWRIPLENVRGRKTKTAGSFGIGLTVLGKSARKTVGLPALTCGGWLRVGLLMGTAAQHRSHLPAFHTTSLLYYG